MLNSTCNASQHFPYLIVSVRPQKSEEETEEAKAAGGGGQDKSVPVEHFSGWPFEDDEEYETAPFLQYVFVTFVQVRDERERRDKR